MSTSKTPTSDLISNPPPGPPPGLTKNPETFLQHIESFFKAAAAYVSKVFVDIFGSSAAKQFAAGAEALIETSLGQIAMTAVTKAQSLANNSEKFAQASSEILAEAKSEGIAVSDSIVNMLIELCVQRLKGSFSAS